jgi:hypothetical protein
LAFACTWIDWAMKEPRWVCPFAVPKVNDARGATIEPQNAVSMLSAVVPMYSTKSRDGSAPVPKVARQVKACATNRRVGACPGVSFTTAFDSKITLAK